jgi:single-strand DNA-binding protein
MANLTRVLLIGNCTRDIELRYTTSGTAIADFGIAVNRVWKNDSGEKQEEVTFVDIQVWGRLAEIAGEYLSKGSSVFIEGRLKLDTWDDKQSGQKRSKLRVVGENLQLLGAKRQETSNPPPPKQPASASRPQPPEDPGAPRQHPGVPGAIPLLEFNLVEAGTPRRSDRAPST